MDNSNGLTYVITRLIVLTNVLILCMLINSKLVIYIIILILSYLFGLPQLTLYCYTTSISHGVEKYFPRLWGTGISDAIFQNLISSVFKALKIYLSKPYSFTKIKNTFKM